MFGWFCGFLPCEARREGGPNRSHSQTLNVCPVCFEASLIPPYGKAKSPLPHQLEACWESATVVASGCYHPVEGDYGFP